MGNLIIHAHPYAIGVDEAGRGCLAGPVVAASFMPGHDFIPPKGLNDSKKMSPKAREYCYEYLVDNYVDRMGVAMTHADVIDRINILRATIAAMCNSITSNPAFMRGYSTGWNGYDVLLLIDGNTFTQQYNYPGFPSWIVPYQTVVKGDGKYVNIAAASVIAKVTRDRYIVELSKDPRYAAYGWEKNKSYCTPDHMAAIIKHGKSDLHRMTFKVPGYDK